MELDDFLEELKDALVEHEFASRWSKIEGYHFIGKSILEQGNTYGKNVVGQVAKHLGKSERTVRYYMQFAEKYPDLSELPDGKNISWNKIIQRLEGREKAIPRVKTLTCPECGCEFYK